MITGQDIMMRIAHCERTERNDEALKLHTAYVLR